MVAKSQEVQKLVQDAKVYLLTIDYTHLDGGTIHRFSNSKRFAGTVIEHNTQTFDGRRFEMSGLAVTAGGPAARPILKLDNTDRLWYSIIKDFKQLRRAKINYKVVYAQHLDGGSDPDTTQIIDEHDLEVFQFTQLDNVELGLRLNELTDSEEAMFGRQMLRHTCNRTYRVPTSTPDVFIDLDSDPDQITCPYGSALRPGTGSDYFKEDGTVTALSSEDKCGQRNSDCEDRFGTTATLPAQLFSIIGNPTV